MTCQENSKCNCDGCVIGRLRVELANERTLHLSTTQALWAAEARLAAVLALCDAPMKFSESFAVRLERISVAALGEGI